MPTIAELKIQIKDIAPKQAVSGKNKAELISILETLSAPPKRVIKRPDVAPPVSTPVTVPKRKRPVVAPSKEIMESQIKSNRDKALLQLRQEERDTQERNLKRRNESRRMTSLQQLRQVELDTQARNKARKEQIDKPLTVPVEKNRKPYMEYVDNYKKRRQEADNYRKLIKDKAEKEGIMNPLARFMGAAEISFEIDDEPLLTINEWIQRTRAEEAYLASAPERYKKALEREEVRNLTELEKAKKPLDLSGVIDPIPSKKSELLTIIRSKEIKGFSGKGVPELQALIEKYNEQLLIGLERRKKSEINEIIENLNAIGAFRVLMGFTKIKLEIFFNYFKELREEEKEEQEELRSSIPRRVAQDDVPRVNALIAKLNAKTSAFNDKYRTMGLMIRDALDFKETNKYKALERFLSVSYGDGIPLPIEVYLKGFHKRLLQQ